MRGEVVVMQADDSTDASIAIYDANVCESGEHTKARTLQKKYSPLRNMQHPLQLLYTEEPHHQHVPRSAILL